VLVVTDVQRDFLSGGALAVAIILVGDYHPPSAMVAMRGGGA
jgi:hypothetical protein